MATMSIKVYHMTRIRAARASQTITTTKIRIASQGLLAPFLDSIELDCIQRIALLMITQ